MAAPPIQQPGEHGTFPWRRPEERKNQKVYVLTCFTPIDSQPLRLLLVILWLLSEPASVSSRHLRNLLRRFQKVYFLTCLPVRTLTCLPHFTANPNHFAELPRRKTSVPDFFELAQSREGLPRSKIGGRTNFD